MGSGCRLGTFLRVGGKEESDGGAGGLYQVYGLLQGRGLWGFVLLFLCRKLGDKKGNLWFVSIETIPIWHSVSIKELPVVK